LIVDDRLPDPTVGSGFGRLDQAIDRLAAARYGIDFYPVDRCVRPADRLWHRGVCIIDVELDVHLSQPDLVYDVVILSRPHNFERYAALVRRQQPQAALIYDAEALFHIRLQRQVAFVPDPAVADSIRIEAERMRHLESDVRRAADAIVCVSREEAEYVEQFPGNAPVVVVPPFVSSARWTGNDFDHRSGAVFVAGWLAGDGSPNVDAICWFAAEVVPRIRRAVPDFHTIVTGANPPGTVAGLDCAWLHVVGHVADLSALYDQVRVAVAPVRFGAGVKVKTLEALQHGVPVVATEVGAEGLGVEGSASVRVSGTAEGFADAIVSLVTDRAAWRAARDSIEPSLRALDRHGGMANWEWAVEAALLTRTPDSVRSRLAREAGRPGR
jgi:glycosyltransferase involved in cell wall biosynthesis